MSLAKNLFKVLKDGFYLSEGKIVFCNKGDKVQLDTCFAEVYLDRKMVSKVKESKKGE